MKGVWRKSGVWAPQCIDKAYITDRRTEFAAGRVGGIGKVEEIEGKPGAIFVEQTPIAIPGPVDPVDADRTGIRAAH